jgi:hypothetical protein
MLSDCLPELKIPGTRQCQLHDRRASPGHFWPPRLGHRDVLYKCCFAGATARWWPCMSRRLTGYLIPTTIESGPARCST